MKFLKWFLFILIALYLIGFLLPSKTNFSRSKEIKASPAALSSLIADYHQWPKWSPWSQIDPNMKVEYINGGVGKGSGYKWTSDNKDVGSGTMMLTDMNDNRISHEMEFSGMGKSAINFDMAAKADLTNLTWSLSSDGSGMPLYFKPISRWFNMLLMDKMMGPMFEKGLNQLAELAPNVQVNAAGGKVESVSEMQAAEMHFIQIESKCAVNDIGPKLGELYARISHKMIENKLKPAGMPMAMYPGIQATDTVTRIIAMMSTDAKCTKQCGADMTCGTIPARKVIKAVYYGPYEANTIAYEAIQKYMAEKNLQAAGDPYEEYANDPMEVKDPAKYQTNVYWPVK